VKKVEDASCAIRGMFDSLATYVVFRVARGCCCHEKASKALEEIKERREISCSCISRCSQRKWGGTYHEGSEKLHAAILQFRVVSEEGLTERMPGSRDFWKHCHQAHQHRYSMVQYCSPSRE
jgi:hypothetical protein